jgi:hypothetical protein
VDRQLGAKESRDTLKPARSQNLRAAAVRAVVAFTTTTIARAADPLPSWNDGKARQPILGFVER